MSVKIGKLLRLKYLRQSDKSVRLRDHLDRFGVLKSTTAQSIIIPWLSKTHTEVCLVLPAVDNCTGKEQFIRVSTNDTDRAESKMIIITRNVFCGTWYLPHSHVHNERTIPIIMAGCIAHARNGRISTSGEKSDVTIVFLDSDFL